MRRALLRLALKATAGAARLLIDNGYRLRFVAEEQLDFDYLQVLDTTVRVESRIGWSSYDEVYIRPGHCYVPRLGTYVQEVRLMLTTRGQSANRSELGAVPVRVLLALDFDKGQGGNRR